MAKTQAIRALDSAGAEYELCAYKYVERGGTAASSKALGVSEHIVIKTLVFEDERKRALLALMHGDAEVSTKKLARAVQRKRVSPCSPATAQKHSGYMIGGTSPFGLKEALPIYAQESIAALPLLYINAGRRGLLFKMSSATLLRLTQAHLLEMRA